MERSLRFNLLSMTPKDSVDSSKFAAILSNVGLDSFWPFIMQNSDLGEPGSTFKLR